ncbi:MAG TPA: GrpB family protein [Rhabdochlamydiaceae bacterium]|jgi:GrpB-like predicted nucleotidyltransferase (UPF0157 family)
MKKYVFKEYNALFPELFRKEKQRIASHLKTALAIEHVGSTAVPDLGGKGIIDIAIAVKMQNLKAACEQLQKLGYEFRPTFSTQERLYFVIYLPDPLEEIRRYHVHLSFPESREWKDLIAFRDYLREHPDEAREYADIKRSAVQEANEEGELYRNLKKPMFEKIQRLRDKE